MEAAKQFVSQFTSKKGHKTYVEESVKPAVTRETIKPSRHEIRTEAIDREVHQHHYHTTVQPISHREVLPEKHTHNLLPATHRDFSHETHDAHMKVKGAHEHELGLFKHHSITHPTTHTKSAAPTVVGEHVHHHIHEVLQPIIFKETHQPEIVHTSVPIHEIHHHEPIHHPMSEIAAVTMEAFHARHKTAPSIGRETYEGQPRPYNTKFHVDPAKFHHKPTAVNIAAANRKSISTPPLSPASAASSESMPSTPKHHNAADPDFRTSEDSMRDFNLNHSPSTKHTMKHSPSTTTTTNTTSTTTTMRNGRIVTPQQIRL